MKYILSLCIGLISFSFLNAQNAPHNVGSNHGNKFEALGNMLPTPNEYRTASGAPGHKYWQQRCDYDIACEIDEPNLKLIGKETVTYFNNSPDELRYLWLQLDENQHSTVNNANYQNSNSFDKEINVSTLQRLEESKIDNGYGHIISLLTDASGKKLNYFLNKTMLRIDLPTPLKPGQTFTFKCNWSYKIPDRMTLGGRGGLEYFPEDGNHLFTIAQWYPRLCVYSDNQGWQNHQFTGNSEFALTFGNFKVAITVPSDHIVMSTGECINYAQVLTNTQFKRYNQSTTAKEPVEIVTLAEATAAEKNKSTKKKTWIFNANMVRDFAFGSSRKFCWDAMATNVEGKKVMCMSAYPKEAYHLYRKYSTKVVAHTIKTYSKFTIPYPYPVAQSIEASNGMEYPMICFNYGRTEKDGTYTQANKNGMIGVITHEVGHNFFPMIINSDEREYSWMDEGLNSFVEYLTEELWDNNFPTRRGPAWGAVDYMKLPKDQLEPIMTNSENLISLGNNAYTKPSCGLNILRETVVGRELFDFGFKEYCRRWAFKHPTPADFFRTMNDATAENLDWFWRGWFYSTDPCDIAIDTVRHAVLGDSSIAENPNAGKTIKRSIDKPLGYKLFDDISKIRNRDDKSIVFVVDADTSLQDFYYKYDRGIIAYDSSKKYEITPRAGRENLDATEKNKYANTHLYEVTFLNKGGLVMPIIIEFTFEDGSKELHKIPAQIWRKNENKVTKVFMTSKKASAIKLDPLKETADIDEKNNVWGNVAAEPSKFTIFKTKQMARGASGGSNPMQVLK